jgi:hypothetical protein
MILFRSTICHQLRFFDGTMNYRPSLSLPGDKFQRADEISMKSTWRSLGLVGLPYKGRNLKKFEFSRQIFENSSSIVGGGGGAIGSRIVPSGQAGRQTDTTKLIAAFRNLANALKKGVLIKLPMF